MSTDSESYTLTNAKQAADLAEKAAKKQGLDKPSTQIAQATAIAMVAAASRSK